MKTPQIYPTGFSNIRDVNTGAVSQPLTPKCTGGVYKLGNLEKLAAARAAEITYPKKEHGKHLQRYCCFYSQHKKLKSVTPISSAANSTNTLESFLTK